MKLLIETSALIPLYEGILRDRSLGGTETAVLKIAKELTQQGVQVDIRTTIEQGSQGRVRFLGQKDFVDYLSYDACIIVQNWRVLHLLPAVDKLKIFLWTGDGAEQYSNLGIGDRRIQRRIEALFVTSEFHRDSLCSASGYPKEKTFVIGNGVGDDFICDEDYQRRGLIYHSAPYRGLSFLLAYYEELLKTKPNLFLNVFSDMELYRRGEKYIGPHSDVLDKVVKRYCNLSGLKFHQTIPQFQLANELKNSRIFPYPCTVPEVFCMSMLEAMAAGVVPLVANIGGLAEVLADDDLIVDGKPGQKSFDGEFVRRLNHLIADDQFVQEKSQNLKRRAKELFKWSQKAELLKSYLEKLCS